MGSIGWLMVIGLFLKFSWTRLRGGLVPGTFLASAQRKAERRHRFITEPGPYRLAVVSVLTLILLTALSLAILRGLSQAQSIMAQGEDLPVSLSTLRQATIIGMHTLVVLLPFALLSKDVRATVAVGSDVVGYWPIASHPLAAPPYRFQVVRAAVSDMETISRPVVIVGHSQGSVLAFALVGELAKAGWPREDMSLVTCGSPLSSLYSAYFPRHFPTPTRTKVASSVRAWTNFWRTTDPIASPLNSAADGEVTARPVDYHLPDGLRRAGEPELRIHSDYWLESEQFSVVRTGLTPLEPGVT